MIIPKMLFSVHVTMKGSITLGHHIACVEKPLKAVLPGGVSDALEEGHHGVESPALQER